MPGAEERGVRELMFKGYRILVWEGKKILKTVGNDSGTNVNILNVTELHT